MTIKKGAAIAVDIYELPVVSVGAFLGADQKTTLYRGCGIIRWQDRKRISV